MIFFITLLIIATILIAARVLAPQTVDRRVIFAATPDVPHAFGPSMSWLAVRSDSTDDVAVALGAVTAEPANWNSGIGTIYDGDLGPGRIYVTAPVGGWVFAISASLPHPQGSPFVDKCTPLLVDLSERFPEVQYFASFPDVDLFAWAKASSGRVARAFGYGDQGIVWDKGRPTREERQLGLKLFELRGVRGRKGDAGGELLMHPTEEHVMRLAGQWSLNPTLLDGFSAAAGTGLICDAPAIWRPERIRRSA